jgi:FMN-dependent NADH-azoreductase
VDSSARFAGSASRGLVDALIAGLRVRQGPLEVRVRDLAAEPLPPVDAAWVEANFTAPEERSEAHREALALSDALVDELEAADVVVMGIPVYNFGVPSTLKAWIDMVARARRTFRYTANGPEGLLRGKTAYLLLASGGVAVDSPVDFATPYMRQVLSFIGIDDVHVIAADRGVVRGPEAVATARRRIAEVLRAAGRSSSAQVRGAA